MYVTTCSINFYGVNPSGAHVTLFTLHSNAFIKLYQTHSNSIKHFTHHNIILFEHYQTLSNYQTYFLRVTLN